MKHFNIPVFVPHYGCPFSCVFCNQKEITGQSCAAELDEARETIDTHLATINSPDVEIAFFGGSFTAIPKDIMLAYLKLGYEYVKSGKVSGIRISTRPDFIDIPTLSLLKEYGVTVIELGAQSFVDDVLLKSGRGHSAEDTKKACRLIKELGFSLGIQLMTGLVGDTEEYSVYSAKTASELAPDCVRIYPTLVLKDTMLSKLYADGKYSPQTLDEAVETVGRMLTIFSEKKIPVIRVGLASVDEMNRRNAVIAGPDHPALRELCEGRAYLKKIEKFLSGRKCSHITVFAPVTEFSKIIGHKRANADYLRQNYKVTMQLVASENFDITAE